MRLFAVAALLFAHVAGALAADPPQPAAAPATQTLRIGVEGAYPPFSEIATDGTLKGFDIDIARAVCAHLKVTCKLVQAEFDAMIPALRAKKFDAIVASMSITPERRKAVDFSSSYYNSSARVVTRADATFDVSAAGLQGKKVGVQRATIHDRYATAVFKGSRIVRYGKQDEVFLDLVNGRVDATLVDAIAASDGFLKKPAGRGFAFRGPAFDDPAYFGIGVGIAVRKGDAALLQRIDQALAAILADGTHKRLQARYFDVDISPTPLKK